MVEAVLFLLLLGLGSGVLLAVASRAFYVWEDPKVLAVTDALPGANCGGCGNAGCAAAAEGIVAGRVPLNCCVVGGLETALAVGNIMGQKVEAREPDFHWTSCTYGVGEADPLFTYNGATDCRAAVLLYGGSKVCPIGCIGLGSCVKACKFDALKMGEHNLPVADLGKCVGCGACVTACPKNIVCLTSATRRIQAEYATTECTAPCQRACPTGIDIPGYIREIRRGRFEQALRIIKEKCPLSLVCGYICPAPCELECRRNLVDQGVAIDPLKRFVADYEMATGRRIDPYRAPDNGMKIALVGGGAEGLTAAYYLARLGYRPTIHEAKPQLGGILRYVISRDRLPQEVLDHDIQGILAMGVDARTGVEMGRDFTAAGLLREGYDAVILTSGGFDSRKILNPHRESYASPVSGLVIMLDFLVALSRGEEVRIGKRVVIQHSGLKGLEVARSCRAMGAERVTLVTHEPVENLPAALKEFRRLEADGIDVQYSTKISAIGGTSDQLRRLALEKTVRPEIGLCEVSIRDADMLILSGGRFPELVFVKAGGSGEGPGGELRWQTAETFRTFPAGGETGLLAPPEPGRVSDSSAVVQSILSGRRLARAVHQQLSGGAIAPIANLACAARAVLNVSSVHHVPASERVPVPRADVDTDVKSSWVFPEKSPGLDEAAAKREAERCLQCGLICYQKTGMEKSESRHV